MRGEHRRQETMFSCVAPEARVPQGHPLRPIRAMVDQALAALDAEFEALCSHTGRPSIPTEFVSAAIADCAEQRGMKLCLLQPGKPMQNGFIERFNGSYRRGVLNLYVFRTLTEVREHTERWLHDHNQTILADALGGFLAGRMPAAAHPGNL